MHIDWPINWESELSPTVEGEVDFWVAWKGLNEMRQVNYEEEFAAYLWGKPQSAWMPWQHRAAAADMMLPWHNWAERYPYTLCERACYTEWLYNRNRSGGGGTVWWGSVMAISRHDFYNIDTGFELMAAIQRAGAAHPISINQTKRLQQCLDDEARKAIAQSAGRRSLADRYRDLSQRIEAANTLSRRQIPTCEIDPPQLRESDSEQRFRLDYTYALRQQYGDVPAKYAHAAK
jgi:hypothetical protein